MSGDADEYHSFTIECKTEAELKTIVETLTELGFTDPESYGSVEGFEDIFEEQWHFSEFFGDRYDKLNGYEITYYDENGVKYDVEVEGQYEEDEE